MTTLNGNAAADPLDEKMLGTDDSMMPNKECQKKPEKKRKALFSIFQAKKKELEFDKNETIDCISKGLFENFDIKRCFSQFRNLVTVVILSK